MTILKNAIAVGAGTEAIVMKGSAYPPSNHTIQIEITGAPTAVTVAIEARLVEGTKWKALNTYAFSAGELTAGMAMFHITGAPVEIIRANVTVLTAGTAPTVSVYHLGA